MKEDLKIRIQIIIEYNKFFTGRLHLSKAEERQHRQSHKTRVTLRKGKVL